MTDRIEFWNEWRRQRKVVEDFLKIAPDISSAAIVVGGDVGNAEWLVGDGGKLFWVQIIKGQVVPA